MSQTSTKPLVFYDVDNTLYPKSSGVSDQVKANIGAFCVNAFEDVTADTAGDYAVSLYHEYGLTLRGLQKTRGEEVDVDAYLDAVHDALPLEELVPADPRLRSMMESLRAAGVEQWVATNSDERHARRCLAALGVTDLFDGVVFVDPKVPDYKSKPEAAYYVDALTAAGRLTTDPNIYFIDDSVTNCAAARALGWHVAYCCETAENTGKDVDECAQVTIRTIHEIVDVWPHLLQGPEESKKGDGGSGVAADAAVGGSSDASAAAPPANNESLEGLVTLLHHQLKTTDWLDSHPASGESFAEIAAANADEKGTSGDADKGTA